MDKFSEQRHVLDSCVIRWSRSREDKMPNSHKARINPENSSTANSKFAYNRFAFPNKHQILSVRFDETFCGNSVNNFDCRAFSLFENVTGSRIKTLRFYGVNSL